MKEKMTREDPKIVAAAERRMQTWELSQRLADRAAGQTTVPPPHMRIGPYLTISREAGAGGSEIGQAVGARLGWEVLDKGLLEQVANRSHLPKETLQLVDETESSWVFDVLGPWFDRGLVPHEKYVALLARVVVAAARRGKIVFVGRGARFLLPRSGGLAVRIIAPLEYRVKRLVQQQNVDAAHARQLVDRIDRGRRDLVRRYFHQDIDDPHLYDLVVNVDQIGLSGAVEQILLAMAPFQQSG